MSPAEELACRSYLLLPAPDGLGTALAEAYGAWAAFFASTRKFTTPGSLSVPSGYLPFCQRGGCEMKESFYAQPGLALPPLVRRATDTLVALLLRQAAAIAADLRLSWGAPLITETRRGCLRVMRYAAFEGEAESPLMRRLAEGGALRAGPHTDLNGLTILPPATAPGLEILDPDLGWRDVEPAAGRIVVHGGQELEARSAGRFRATTHRVRNPTAAEAATPRLAFALFVS